MNEKLHNKPELRERRKILAEKLNFCGSIFMETTKDETIFDA